MSALLDAAAGLLIVRRASRDLCHETLLEKLPTAPHSKLLGLANAVHLAIFRVYRQIHAARMIESLTVRVGQETVLSRLKVRQNLVWRRVLTGLLCVCLCVWTTVPSVSHTPKFLETVQEHLQMIEDHGHSHGLEFDLLWAMHGHQHDLADHDHNTAMLVKSGPRSPHAFDTSSWRLPVSDPTSALIFPPKRPPRN